MKKLLIIVPGLLFLTACGASKPQGPNPHAEDVLLAFAEAINSQDFETARTYFSQEADVRFEGATWPVEGVSGWMDWASTWNPQYEFSEFVITGDEVEFQWVFEEMMMDTLNCVGNAVMDGEKITYLRMTGCDYPK